MLHMVANNSLTSLRRKWFTIVNVNVQSELLKNVEIKIISHT